MSPPLRAVAFPPGVSWEHAPFFRVCCRAPSPQGTFLDFWDQSMHRYAHCEGPWLLLTSPPVRAVASGSVPVKGAHKMLCFQWPLWVESPSACMDAPVSQERVRLVLTPQYRVLRGGNCRESKDSVIVCLSLLREGACLIIVKYHSTI